MDEMTMSEQFLGAFIPIHYHYNMLLDDVRMSSFRGAIDCLTPLGGKALELGGGTGVLSHYAAQKASRVWCIERNPELVSAARRFLELNHSTGRVEVIQADAREYLPPERVDVVICEMLHVALAREKQIEVIDSFQRRYLEMFGPPLPAFIPEASLLAVQPVEQSFEFNGYTAPIPLFQTPGAEHASTRGLSQTAVYSSVEYGRSLPTHFDIRVDFSVAQSGTLNAVRFVTKNLLALQVSVSRAIEWSNQYLVAPLEEPLAVRAGEVITISSNYAAGCELNQLVSSVQACRKNQHRAAA